MLQRKGGQEVVYLETEAISGLPAVLAPVTLINKRHGQVYLCNFSFFFNSKGVCVVIFSTLKF